MSDAEKKPRFKTVRKPKPKKTASLAMRITQSTRDALEFAALEDGLSVARVAEAWLVRVKEEREKPSPHLRDEFAMAALRAMMIEWNGRGYDFAAAQSYLLADAMMKAREVKS